MINKKKVESIERLATELISKYSIDKPSIPIDMIAQKEGLSLVSHDLGENVSGVLVIKDKKGIIGYNVNHAKVRRRFTIAHELGHYVLHGHLSDKDEVFVDKDFIVKFRNNINSYNKAEERQESEANAFAAALLMPEHLIEKEFENSHLAEMGEPELISYLAKKFEVSVLAMTYRLTNLNLFVY